MEIPRENFPGKYKACNFYCIAVDKVNFVGDIVAAVVGTNRYVAEDGVELVEVEYEPLTPVLDAEEGAKPGSPVIHEEWGDNLMLNGSLIESGDVDKAFSEADVTVKGRFQMNRHCAAPLEERAVVASHDPVLKQMTVWTSSQMPHMVRTKIAEAIDYPEHTIRVISPDVGGGFGLKCHIFPEELILALLTREIGRPIKWIEDRRENLYGSYHAKDELCYAELALKKDGTILGLKAKFIGDVGAYTSYPWTPSLRAVAGGAGLSGSVQDHERAGRSYGGRDQQDDIECVSRRGTAGGTVHDGTYDGSRGVQAEDGSSGIAPQEHHVEQRLPVNSATGLDYDSASSRESLDLAVKMIDYAKFRKEQAEALKNGKYLGIGFSSMIEQTTFGFDYWKNMGLKNVSGYESAHLRVDPNGGVTLTVGTHSHGQGHATVYAQLVADGLGCKVEDVTFVQGDTAMTPYGWGTWGSRSAIAGGGAVINATAKIRDKMVRVAANLMEVSPRDLEVKDGKISVKGVSSKSMTLRDVAHSAVYTADVSADEEPGLEAH